MGFGSWSFKCTDLARSGIAGQGVGGGCILRLGVWSGFLFLWLFGFFTYLAVWWPLFSEPWCLLNCCNFRSSRELFRLLSKDRAEILRAVHLLQQRSQLSYSEKPIPSCLPWLFLTEKQERKSILSPLKCSRSYCKLTQVRQHLHYSTDIYFITSGFFFIWSLA